MERGAIVSSEDVGAKAGLAFYNRVMDDDKPVDVAVLGHVEVLHGSGVVVFTLVPDCGDGVVQESKFLDRLLVNWCALGVPISLQKLTVNWCVLMYDLEVDRKFEDPKNILMVMKDTLEPGGKVVTDGFVIKVWVEFLKMQFID